MSSSGTVTSDDGSAKVTNQNGDIEFYLQKIRPVIRDCKGIKNPNLDIICANNGISDNNIIRLFKKSVK